MATVRRARLHRVASLVLGFGVAFLSPAAASAADQFAPYVAADRARWDPWIELGGYWGTDGTSRGEVVLFTPLLQTPDSVVFTELRGKLFEDDVREGNFALGRRVMAANGFNYGAWIGVDVRNTQIDNTFTWISGGVEALSQNWDFRANAYVPVSDPKLAGGGFAGVFLQGGTLVMVGGTEVPLYGIDAEAGYRMAVGENATLGLYGGGFYFDHEDAFQSVAGPKARAELEIANLFGTNASLTGEYEFSYDDVRKDRHEAGLRLRIPLGSDGPTRTRPHTAQERRMVAGLERDTDNLTGQSDIEGTRDFYTDVPFDTAVVATDPNGLQAALDGAGENSLTVLAGVFEGNVTVGPNRTVYGGYGPLPVVGDETGAKGEFHSPFYVSTVSHTGAAPVLTVDDRVHLAGFDITGGGGRTTFVANNDGVQGGAGNFNVFSHLDVMGMGELGFDFRNAANANVQFHDVYVGDVRFDGVSFALADNSVSNFTNVWVTNTGNRGFDFAFADNAVANFTNVWVTDAGGVGIDFFLADNAVANFTNVWVSNTGSRGIDLVAADGLTATFTDVTFSGTIGNAAGSTDALFRSSGAPLASLNGNIINNTDNIPPGDLCQGDFVGTVLFENGAPVTISDGVGCAALPSDRRLKRDITLLTTLDSGIALYAFRYLWSEETQVGVMAQDLLEDPRHADAAIMTASGYYVVDYTRLGLRMVTLAEWQARGVQAVALDAQAGAVQALVAGR